MAGLQEEVKQDGAQRLDPLVLLRKCATTGLAGQIHRDHEIWELNHHFYLGKKQLMRMLLVYAGIYKFEGFLSLENSAVFGLMTPAK